MAGDDDITFPGRTLALVEEAAAVARKRLERPDGGGNLIHSSGGGSVGAC
jgi:hypothetical protein